MKIYKLLLLALLVIFNTDQLFAHALWIETNTIGKSGQQHEIKVFYGEYVNNEKEKIEKWYSDVKEFSLWLTAPGKEKVKLNTVAKDDYFSANFTPEKDGVYFITVVHEAKDLGGTTKYEFSSVATVAVGKFNAIDLSSVANSLKVSAADAKVYKANTPVQVKAVLNGQPLANRHVSIFSPEGWGKEFTTDANGVINFNPIWPGRYVVEASNFVKNGGEHHGKEYKAAWQGATSSFEVTK